jgi:hypothetical protein
MNRDSYLFELLLLNRIALMKKQLVDVANETGLGSNETIKFSQELDRLLNLHMKHCSSGTTSISNA